MDANPRFTLRQLQYFVIAARTGQISTAAAQASISQSAMTVAIAELERVLGARLFDRTRSGVSLTPEGHAFLQQAQVVLEAVTEAARFPFQRRTDVEGTLEVAATYTVLGYFLLPALARFRKLFPLVDVVPVELARPQIETRIAQGKLSLAVLILSNLERPKELRTLTLTRSRRQLWMAYNHALAERASVGLDEVAAYPYILPTVDEGERNAELYWQDAAVKPRAWLKTSSMEALREMVALGLGVTILSDMLFRPWSLDGRRIQAVPLDTRIPVMDIGLAWHRSAGLDPCAKAFKDFLAASFANPAVALA